MKTYLAFTEGYYEMSIHATMKSAMEWIFNDMENWFKTSEGALTLEEITSSTELSNTPIATYYVASAEMGEEFDEPVDFQFMNYDLANWKEMKKEVMEWCQEV